MENKELNFIQNKTSINFKTIKFYVFYCIILVILIFIIFNLKIFNEKLDIMFTKEDIKIIGQKIRNKIIFDNEILGNKLNNTRFTEEFNETSCADYENPADLYQCKQVNISTLINKRQHTCCFFKMTSPRIMNTCIPVETVFLPISKMDTNIKLPGDIEIIGNVDCFSKKIINSFFAFLLIIFII